LLGVFGGLAMLSALGCAHRPEVASAGPGGQREEPRAADAKRSPAQQPPATTGSKPANGWKPAKGPLKSPWADRVDPARLHPEYPRPQMVRPQWVSLNGLWQYSRAVEGEPPPVGRELPGRILVPFPIESAQSGVMEPAERLWYRRTFGRPAGRRVLLHFEAVDWAAGVWVNGQKVGEHRGGYDLFSFDITDALKPDGPQELIVGVFDPTDNGDQPRGKQVRKPEGIWYTPCTGIWQSVWLEPVPQPVEIGFDEEFGDRVSLKTYRGGTGWDGEGWPDEQQRGPADETAWEYDPATGLLEVKRYADASEVVYAWTPDGRLAHRLWARLHDSQPLATVYGYYDADHTPNTGELRAIDYADGTPDVTYSYTRTGSLYQVEDGVGLRSFGYDEALQRHSETFEQGSLFAGRTITSKQWHYTSIPTGEPAQPGGPVPVSWHTFPRPSRLQVGDAPDDGSDYQVDYAYRFADARLRQVSGTGLPGGGVEYDYLADSRLVERVQYKQDTILGESVRSFEANRDLLTAVENRWGEGGGSQIVSRYAYSNDSLGRRKHVIRTGSAFDGQSGRSPEHADAWSYNARNELTGSQRFNDTTPPFDPQSEVAALGRAFEYDHIGNRRWYDEGTADRLYYCANALNQYTSLDDDTSDCPPGGVGRYRAYSVARISRSTVTLISPG